MCQNVERWCFSFPHPLPTAPWTDRAALLLPYQWSSALPITISFLDDDHGLARRVEAAARQWIGPKRANLRFGFLNDRTDTHVRISFRHPGSWSMLGNSCLQNTTWAEPTMNFGWLNAASSELELERVVLHEFGHALGLVHEHQNPMSNIQWDRDAVYRDLEGQWSRKEIDENVFDPVGAAAAAATPFDPTSIMVYPIKRSWTKDGFSCDLNARLSPIDIQFIRNIYQ